MPGLGLSDFPQPVAVATAGTDAYYGQASKTTQDLSTGKGSGHNNLAYLPQAKGPQRADTIHLRRLNSKASHCRMPKTRRLILWELACLRSRWACYECVN
ncbi:hypothetical protein RS3R2_01960 [Pseudomonas lactis]|nr:hypothetical protein RS3R2_01960 [Pseudomonas lactis]